MNRGFDEAVVSKFVTQNGEERNRKLIAYARWRVEFAGGKDEFRILGHILHHSEKYKKFEPEFDKWYAAQNGTHAKPAEPVSVRTELERRIKRHEGKVVRVGGQDYEVMGENLIGRGTSFSVKRVSDCSDEQLAQALRQLEPAKKPSAA